MVEEKLAFIGGQIQLLLPLCCIIYSITSMPMATVTFLDRAMQRQANSDTAMNIILIYANIIIGELSLNNCHHFRYHLLLTNRYEHHQHHQTITNNRHSYTLQNKIISPFTHCTHSYQFVTHCIVISPCYSLYSNDSLLITV